MGYRLTFGKVGDTYPVPPLTLATEDANEMDRAVAEHAIPYLTPVLEDLGRPELADCFFRSDTARTAGCFMWLDLAKGEAARFCAVHIEPTA